MRFIAKLPKVSHNYIDNFNFHFALRMGLGWSHGVDVKDEIDEVVRHPAHHGEVGQEEEGDLNYEVEVDDEEDSQGEADVQYLSVVNVGRDNLGLPGLNTRHDEGRHRDVEQSQQQLDQLHSPRLVERLHLKDQQHEPS